MTFAFYGPTNLENFTMSNNNGFIDVKNEISVSTWKNHTNRSYTQTPYMFIENDKRKSLINSLIYQQAFLSFFSICHNLDLFRYCSIKLLLFHLWHILKMKNYKTLLQMETIILSVLSGRYNDRNVPFTTLWFTSYENDL